MSQIDRTYHRLFFLLNSGTEKRHDTLLEMSDLLSLSPSSLECFFQINTPPCFYFQGGPTLIWAITHFIFQRVSVFHIQSNQKYLLTIHISIPSNQMHIPDRLFVLKFGCCFPFIIHHRKMNLIPEYTMH